MADVKSSYERDMEEKIELLLKNSEISDEEKEKIVAWWKEHKKKYEVVLSLLSVLEEPIKSESDKVLDLIVSTEKDLLEVDAYLGIHGENEAAYKYDQLDDYIRKNKKLSAEEKSQLNEIVSKKRAEFPIKIKEVSAEENRKQKEEKLQAWKEAKTRYNSLSIFGKIKCRIKKETPSMLVPNEEELEKLFNMRSVDSIKKLYGGDHDR